MALPLSNTFEGGSDTTTITAGNSGGASGDAFDVVNIGTSSTCVFSATQAAHGGLSAQLTQAPTTAVEVNCRWTTSIGTGVTELYGRQYVWFDTALPAIAPRIMRIDTTGSVLQAAIQVNSSGSFQIDQVGNTIAGSASATGLVTANAWFRYEWHWIAGNPGTFELRVYSADSTSALATILRTGTDNFGSNADGGVWMGTQAGTLSAVMYLDDVNVNATGFPGPAGAPPAVQVPVVYPPIKFGPF